jgi:phosphoribosylformylglycinamidine synthase
MKSKFGVVIFPGSNGDHDAYYAIKKGMNAEVNFLWHKDRDLQNSNVIVLPGGFAYGDYLRCGAIARFSPIMNSIIEFANKGGTVLGICNGFQVLLEAGLLPGVMIKNKSLQFVCKDVYLTVKNRNTIFTSGIETEKILKIPIAHGEGNYFADDDTLKSLQDNNQIVFQYTSKDGTYGDEFNPNGSTQNIAGIMNKNGNVMGMMPHPERVCDAVLGNIDGKMIFNSILSSLN